MLFFSEHNSYSVVMYIMQNLWSNVPVTLRENNLNSLIWHHCRNMSSSFPTYSLDYQSYNSPAGLPLPLVAINLPDFASVMFSSNASQKWNPFVLLLKNKQNSTVLYSNFQISLYNNPIAMFWDLKLF